MKNKLVSVLSLAAACIAAAFVTGCGTTTGQKIVAVGTGTGEAIGSKLLKDHSTNGVVDAAYLAKYEAEIPNVAGLMQGKITPADLHDILGVASSASLSSDQTAVVGLLNGVTDEFVKVNGGATPTPDGNQVDAAAKQVAAGLGRAVGLVTGTNYVPPSS